MLDRLIELLKQYGKPAVSGASGHNATFSTACFMWRNSSDETAVTAAMNWYNDNMCNPKWNENELAHKVKSARDAVGSKVGEYERGRNRPQQRLQRKAPPAPIIPPHREIVLPAPKPYKPQTNRPKTGDSLTTNTGRSITIHHIFDCGLIAADDGNPYRLIDGVAYAADTVTGLVTTAL